MFPQRLIKLVFAGVFAFLLHTESYAQTNASDSLIVKPKKSTVVKPKTLDTKESISYLGSKLMYQVKKRMNLTTEKEENDEEKKNKKVALSFLGIKIEN